MATKISEVGMMIAAEIAHRKGRRSTTLEGIAAFLGMTWENFRTEYLALRHETGAKDPDGIAEWFEASKEKKDDGKRKA